MTLELILRLLKNSGLNVLGADSVYIYIEDPSCILRGFETFLHYAWFVIAIITGFLLFGWGVSLIRGGKTDIVVNLRNLLIMFATLSVVGPIINAIWGADLFANGCRRIAVPIAEVARSLDARNLKLRGPANSLYEEFQIYDSGAIYDTDIDVAAVSIDDDVLSDTAPDTVGNEIISESVITDAAASGGAGTAYSAGNDVIYINSDGTKTRRSGGSRAWRNNNPGNITYGTFAQKHGAIGTAGGFAVFPDEATGAAAIKSLLRTNSYRDLTIANAISRYAPPSENDTAAYQARIARETGLDMSRRMRDLGDDEIMRVVNTIRRQEGWTPGRSTRI